MSVVSMKNSRGRGWALLTLLAIAACGGSTLGEIPPEAQIDEPTAQVDMGSTPPTTGAAGAEGGVVTDGATPVAHRDASPTPPQAKDASVGPWTPPLPPTWDGGFPFFDGGIPSWEGGFPTFDGGRFDGGFHRDGGISLFDGGINVPL